MIIFAKIIIIHMGNYWHHIFSGKVSPIIDDYRGKNKEISNKPLTSSENSDILKSSEKSKIIQKAYEKAKKEPPNYFELSGRSSSFPTHWTLTSFSSQSTEKDHVKRHAAGVGAKDGKDYVKKAKEFFQKPLGETGDVFVSKTNEIHKYDYETKILAIASNEGTVETFWRLSADMSKEDADDYWERIKNKRKEK